MSNDSNLFREYGDLVRRYKGGDEAAYEEMYEKSKRLVYATCRGILGNDEDAKDAMQDTYLTVYSKLGDLGDEDKFLGWLKRIAAAKALDMYRRKKGDVSYEDAIEAEEPIMGDDNLETLPDTYIMDKAKRDALNGIIRSVLSDVQYQTVILYYYDELPVETIAKLMNCPEGTVKTRLMASRVKIKSAVKEYEDENHDSLAAFVGLPFLTKFFIETSKSLTIPRVRILPDQPTMKSNKIGKKVVKKAVKTADTAKVAPKAGILSTAGGKILAGAIAAAVIIPSAIVITKVVTDDKPETKDKDEEYEEVVTDDGEEVIDEESTSVTEPAFVLLDEPIELAAEDVSDYPQLERFVGMWGYNEYDKDSVPDDLLDFVLCTSEGVHISFDMYFSDFYYESGVEDPNGYFDPSRCYKIPLDELVWTEQNILDLSDEDINRINQYLVTCDCSDGYGCYLADDSYVYYTSGNMGCRYNQEIERVEFDGIHYYVYTNCVDSEEYDYKPDYDPEVDDEKFVFEMEIKNIDGVDYWSMISCKNLSNPSSETTEETVVDLSTVPVEDIDFTTLADNGWKAAYLEKAASVTKDDFDNASYLTDDITMQYGLVFINSDEIPELVCCFTSINGEGFINAYTYTNGEVVKLGDSFYRYKIDVTYAPFGNLIGAGGGISGAGSAVSAEYLYMNDDCTVFEKAEYSSYSFDRSKYTSVEEAIEAGEDTSVWYHYKWDYETNTSVPMSDEEFNEVSEKHKNMKSLWGYMSLEELTSLIG